MKSIFLLMLFSLSAFSMPSGPRSPLPPELRRVELVKCTAPRLGTLWASFGRIWESGQELPRHFPTEILLFQSQGSYRLEFPDFREALKIPVRTGGAFGLEFQVETPAGQVRHKITTLQVRADDDAAFLGNWMQLDEVGRETDDPIACTVK